MVDAGFENQKELTKMQLDNQKEIAEMQNETQKEIAGIQSATSRLNSFFFSSRRRHTILVSDWSSDVCSSDLRPRPTRPARSSERAILTRRRYRLCGILVGRSSRRAPILPMWSERACTSPTSRIGKIGRASCRERV